MDMAMPCMYYGVPLISHRMAKFDAKRAFKMIRDLKINRLFLPPTALKLMRQVEVPDGVNIRSVSSGGESLGAEILGWGKDQLGVEISEIYGQTECNLVLASCPELMPVRAGSMGKAMVGFDVAIIDGEGVEVPDGTIGEIAVKAPNPVMFLRYWGQAEKTTDKFVNGWLRTGDLGHRDADGYFTFSSRDDDVITSAGYRIGPSEIEHCLMGHRDVVMAAVVGVPDALRTEIVKAFVVVRDGAISDGLVDELTDLVKVRISPHVAPRLIEFVSELPMTATGKILRRELRDQG